MRALLAVCLAVVLGALSAPAPARAADDLVVKESAHSVAVTLDRLAKGLEAAGIKIVARIDHAAGAKSVGAELRATEVLIFANPKLGTALMQSSQRIGLDLPLKALAYADDKGKVWLAYTKPEVLKSRYGIADRDEAFGNMAAALEKMTAAATAK